MKKIKLANSYRVALVDDNDYPILNSYRWHCDRKGKVIYAKTGLMIGANTYGVYMHRLILNPAKGMVVDHLDKNGLNNKRCNLKICHTSINMHNHFLQRNNTSGYSGVTWNIDNKKWRAQIKIMGKIMHLGYYTNKKQASNKVERIRNLYTTKAGS